MKPRGLDRALSFPADMIYGAGAEGGGGGTAAKTSSTLAAVLARARKSWSMAGSAQAAMRTRAASGPRIPRTYDEEGEEPPH